jgi:peptide/nickel transport system permease protein
MLRYVIRRSVQSIFLLLGISLMVFTVQQIAPGGPESFTEDPRLGKEYGERLRQEFGLDQPIPVQYGKWLWNALHLNFGRSFVDRRPVIDRITERLPNTMLLAGTSLVLGLAGIPLGVVAALKRGKFFDQFWRVLTVLVNALPSWWLALMILIISVKTVNWFPLAGTHTPDDGSIRDRLHHLILPAFILALNDWLGYSRYMRSEFLDVINQDYVRTARAKGLRERVVIYGHALRNALIPVITILGGTLASLLSIGVLVEGIFSWPGIGRLSLEAAYQRDFPTLMALTMIGATLVITGQLLADIAYTVVDPRVRLS